MKRFAWIFILTALLAVSASAHIPSPESTWRTQQLAVERNIRFECDLGVKYPSMCLTTADWIRLRTPRRYPQKVHVPGIGARWVICQNNPINRIDPDGRVDFKNGFIDMGDLPIGGGLYGDLHHPQLAGPARTGLPIDHLLIKPIEPTSDWNETGRALIIYGGHYSAYHYLGGEVGFVRLLFENGYAQDYWYAGGGFGFGGGPRVTVMGYVENVWKIDDYEGSFLNLNLWFFNRYRTPGQTIARGSSIDWSTPGVTISWQEYDSIGTPYKYDSEGKIFNSSDFDYYFSLIDEYKYTPKYRNKWGLI